MVLGSFVLFPVQCVEELMHVLIVAEVVLYVGSSLAFPSSYIFRIRPMPGEIEG